MISRFIFPVFSGLLICFTLLLQGCGGGGGGGGTTSCTLGSGSNVTVSGKVTFDRVPHDATGLDYNNISQDPARGVVVEAICSGIISTTTTDASGNYSLSVPGNTSNLFIRVKAQMLQSGAPSWNFQVVDNTSAGALYTMDGSTFNVSSSNITRNLHADSGWTGSSYTNPRVAAPFAILDSVYKTINKILAVDPILQFPVLNLNWSVSNSYATITTSHYDGTAIYILGLQDSDTDEYDEHVIVHEWGHYYEDKFSRSDSIGGEHGLGDLLDMRVAFSEGFGNAFSAMILDDPGYKDATGTAQQGLFAFDIDNNTCGATSGWFNECSVQSVLYDLYDNPVSDDDVLSMGMSAIHDAMSLSTRQKGTAALTSLFSFVHYLKMDNNPQASDINALVAAQGVDTVADEFGTGETNDATGTASVLPVYSDITVGGGAVNVCSTGEYQGYNGVGVYRFLKLVPSTTGTLTIQATKTSGVVSSDPDIELFYKGQRIGVAWSTSVDTETLNTVSLTAGETYVIQVNEDDYFNAAYTSGGTDVTCFDVTVN